MGRSAAFPIQSRSGADLTRSLMPLHSDLALPASIKVRKIRRGLKAFVRQCRASQLVTLPSFAFRNPPGYSANNLEIFSSRRLAATLSNRKRPFLSTRSKCGTPTKVGDVDKCSNHNNTQANKGRNVLGHHPHVGKGVGTP